MQVNSITYRNWATGSLALIVFLGLTAVPVNAAKEDNPKPVTVENAPDVNVANAVQIDDSPPIAVDTGEENVLPSSLVTLANSGVDCVVPDVGVVGKAFQRTFADGSITADFIVPSEHVFVVTSVQWSSLFSTPGVAVRFTLTRVGPDSDLRSAMVSHATADAQGTAFGSETIPTGAVFGPGTEPCVRVGTPGPAGIDEDPIISAVRIQGYLASDL